MTTSNKTILLPLLAMLLAMQLQAQQYKFGYQRAIESPTNTWHSVALPSSMYQQLNKQLSDIRIYGHTSNNDTLEVPYLLVQHKKQYSTTHSKLAVINSSKRQGYRYVTLVVPNNKLIDQIDLSFAGQNFDWQIKLEASHNQKQWYTLLERSRMVSVSNRISDYKYTSLLFAASDYKYYRLRMSHACYRQFRNASMEHSITNKGHYRTHTPSKFESKTNKANKTSTINIQLATAVPISELQLQIPDTIDYIRPILIQCATDSTIRKQVWQRHYKQVYRGDLSSFRPLQFEFSTYISKHWRITITNNDNQPLQFHKALLRGAIHELQMRFATTQAQYIMQYSMADCPKAQYDIGLYASKIPDTMQQLSLHSPTQIQSEPIEVVAEPTLGVWLWLLMAVIILLLGYFSVKMIRQESAR